MSPDDYLGISNEIIQFNVGDVRVNHNITIIDDEICEDNPNEFFYSNLTLFSGEQPIIVIRPDALIVIDDTLEPDCSKSCS